MYSGNLSFLVKVKISFQRIVTPNVLRPLIESDVTSVDALLESLSSYPAMECLRMRVGTDIQKLSLKEIFATLTKCWQDDLINIAELTKPKENVIRFITLLMKRYELLELLEALRELSLNQRIITYFPFIDEGLRKKLVDAESIQHLVSILKKHRSVPTVIVAEALTPSSKSSIRELNVDSLRDTVIEEYWRRIMSAAKSIRPKVKLEKCLKNLKLIDALELRVKKAFLEGKELSASLPKLSPRISEIIKGCDPSGIDFTIATLKYVMCVDEMLFSPLSHDITIAYIIAREYEALLLSSLIRSQTLGLDKYFLNEVLNRWLNAYDKITCK